MLLVWTIFIEIAMIVGMLFLGFSGSDGSRSLQHADFFVAGLGGNKQDGHFPYVLLFIPVPWVGAQPKVFCRPLMRGLLVK